MARRRRLVVVIALAVAGCAAAPVATTMDRPLASAGDPGRGRTLVLARDPANCVLCHAIPDPELPVAGDVGPSLAGIGLRLSAGALRLRIVDSARLNPKSIMPRYGVTDGLVDVAPEYRGHPILDPQQVEDLVAYLQTLR